MELTWCVPAFPRPTRSGVSDAPHRPRGPAGRQESEKCGILGIPRGVPLLVRGPTESVGAAAVACTGTRGHPRHKDRAYLAHRLRSKQMGTRRPRGESVAGATVVRRVNGWKSPRPRPRRAPRRLGRGDRASGTGCRAVGRSSGPVRSPDPRSSAAARGRRDRVPVIGRPVDGAGRGSRRAGRTAGHPDGAHGSTGRTLGRRGGGSPWLAVGPGVGAGPGGSAGAPLSRA